MTLCGAAQVSTAEGPGTLPGTKILASSRAEGPGALTAPPGRSPGPCAAQHLRFWAGVRRRCPGPKTQHLPEHHWDNVRFWAHMHWRCAPTVLALHASAVQVSAVQVGVPVLSPPLPQGHRDGVRPSTCGSVQVSRAEGPGHHPGSQSVQGSREVLGGDGQRPTRTT